MVTLSPGEVTALPAAGQVVGGRGCNDELIVATAGSRGTCWKHGMIMNMLFLFTRSNQDLGCISRHCYQHSPISVLC